MAIDIEHENLLSIAELAKQCPGRPHLSTVWRWVLNGLNGIRLESVKVGGKRRTTLEALNRFIDAQSRNSSDVEPSVSRPDREREIDRANRELESFGV